MGSCRCKMCGGHIHYAADASVATCDFCGTEQTIVKSDDSKKVSLFNRANTLRMQNEFDKAQLTYDNILIDEPNNAEAHWGICLCRYGIEYVTIGSKKVPTCHRTSIRSIFDDLDYKEAINNADVVAKRVYENEATVIDKVQKDILEIFQKEEPYDIFISYKEHDESKNRTKDSIKAENIYKALDKKGYRVFFSKVSLNNIDVSKYEPIIFAALMSSKVMLSIGSKADYFNATWEKNEWSRFMTLMKDDRKKYLIPCYFDMDKKDLPEEFMMLQAEDISSEDNEELVKRVDRLFTTSEKVVVTTEQVEVREKVVNKLSVENNIGRIGLFLADGQFAKVKELSEKVLDTDFKCALAYYYKMLASYGCKNEKELIDRRIILDNDKNAEKALMFADNDLKNKIEDINVKVKEAIIEKEKNDLMQKVKSYLYNKKYSEALDTLKSLYNYKNTDDFIIKTKDEIYEAANRLEADKKHKDAISVYSLLDGYKDSNSLIEKIKYIIQVEEACKQCDKLVESVNASINHINNTKVYDQDAIKKIKERLTQIRDLDLCPYAMEKHEALTKKFKDLEEQREKSRKASLFVALGLVGVTIIIVIVVFILAKK